MDAVENMRLPLFTALTFVTFVGLAVGCNSPDSDSAEGAVSYEKSPGSAEQPPIAESHQTTQIENEKPKGLYLGARETEYPDWFKDSFLDFQEDIAEAAKQNKRVMVLFHQENCPYCNELVEKNLSQKNIEEQLKQQFEVIALNMWGDREVVPIQGESLTEKEFAAALKVQFTPTLLFFNEQGQLALRLNGYLPPNRFKKALDFVAGKHEKNTSFRTFAASQSQQSGSDLLHSEHFFSQPPFNLNEVKNRPIAVFFEQTQCPLCTTLHEQALANETTQQILGKFHNIQLDMWSDQVVTLPAGKRLTARAWAKQLNVHYAPTIVLFDADGEEIIRSEAFFKSFHTQSIFDYVASKGYQNEPSFQRYITSRADHLREQGIDVDLWK